MEIVPPHPGQVEVWLAALDRRHLKEFRTAEVGRALRALSSYYVERRARLAEGAALETAGKRAAFALFYAPLHLLTAAGILSALAPREPIREVVDLGCGTGAVGAAWGLHASAPRVTGFDRHPWAVAEANWTYGILGLRGRALRQDLSKVRLDPAPGLGIVAGYTINELSDALRAATLPRLIECHAKGAAVLVIEPIARRMAPWWKEWEESFTGVGGRADEWRFTATLPPRQRELARSAGLNPRELTARSLFAG